MPARLITSAHLAISALTNGSMAASGISMGTPASLAIRSFTAGSASPFLIWAYNFLDNRLRRLFRRPESEPHIIFIARNAGFGDCGNVGHERRTLFAGDRERANGAAFDLAQCARQIVEEHWRLPRYDVGIGWRRAAIGHVREVNAGHQLEQLHRQMLSGAIAGRRVVDLARLRFRQSDEFFDRMCRKIVAYHEDERKLRQHPDGREIADRIVR